MTPSVGQVTARGAGYGAAFGAAFGVFIIPVAGLVPVGDDATGLGAILFLTLVLSPLTAGFGLLYGLVAGLGAAGALMVVPAGRRTAFVARVVAAATAIVVVAAVSRLVFTPSLEVGGNETTEHVVERIVLFYAFPCAAALVAGALTGHRLVAPVPDEQPPLS